jgi:hypothetical protein
MENSLAPARSSGPFADQTFTPELMRIRKFSLRFTLVAVAVLAAVFAYASKQRRIASLLRASDANVKLHYRFQYENYDDVKRYSLDHDAELAPALRFFGPDVASTIVSVSSTGSNDPFEIARLSSQLPHIRQLAIQDTPLKDRDLSPLVSLTKLRGLYLRGTAITDDSVAILLQIRSLRVLNVTNTSLSDSAINQLRQALPGARIHAGTHFGGRM